MFEGNQGGRLKFSFELKPLQMGCSRPISFCPLSPVHCLPSSSSSQFYLIIAQLDFQAIFELFFQLRRSLSSSFFSLCTLAEVKPSRVHLNVSPDRCPSLTARRPLCCMDAMDRHVDLLPRNAFKWMDAGRFGLPVLLSPSASDERELRALVCKCLRENEEGTDFAS